MKPTTTSSETFPTWLRTTQRSSNAGVQTPNLNQLLPSHPPRTAVQSHISYFCPTYLQTHIENMLVFSSQASRHTFPGYLPHVQSSLSWCWLQRGWTLQTVNSLCKHVRAQRLCPSGNMGTALLDQHEVSLCLAKGNAITLPRFSELGPVNLVGFFVLFFFLWITVFKFLRHFFWLVTWKWSESVCGNGHDCCKERNFMWTVFWTIMYADFYIWNIFRPCFMSVLLNCVRYFEIKLSFLLQFKCVYVC